MIVGVGIDIIEVHRVMEKIEKDNGFKEKVFSPREIQFCEANKRAENYAARFAAKEAFLKATGLGLLLGNDLCNIEVVSDANGKPGINLVGNFKVHFDENSWSRIYVSLSHLQEVACAVVIIEK